MKKLLSLMILLTLFASCMNDKNKYEMSRSSDGTVVLDKNTGVLYVFGGDYQLLEINLINKKSKIYELKPTKE